MSASDAYLAHQVQIGNHRAFDVLLRQYTPMVHAQAIRPYGRRRYDGYEELWSVARMALLDAALTYDGSTTFYRWFALKLRGDCLNWLKIQKAEKNTPGLPLEAAASASTPEPSLLPMTVRAAVEELAHADARAYEAIHLRYWWEYEHAEIARAMGVSTRTAYVLHRAGLTHLREALKCYV